MAAKQTIPGTLRQRLEQARRLRGRRRERALAALEREKQELVLSVHDWVWQRVNTFFHHYQLQRQDRDDLAQAAFERVVMGAETYDPSKGKPTTYFGWVAWDGMRKWFKARDLIHVPETSAKAGNAALREHAERVRNGNVLSLDWDYADDGKADAWQSEEPEERPYGFDELERLHDAMRLLSEREREILLDRMAGRTMQAVADDHGISKERVRQIQIRALEKLKRLLRPGESEAARQAGVRAGMAALRVRDGQHQFTSEEARAAAVKSRAKRAATLGYRVATAERKAGVKAEGSHA